MEKPILAAMLSVSSTVLTSEEKKRLEQANPMGISLFARNVQNKAQLKKLVANIKEVIGREDVLIAVDQEGGRVRRLAEPDFRPYVSQIDLGKIEAKFGKVVAEKTIKNHATLISSDMKELGINWNYAPVLDVAYPETAPVLKSRCFSEDETKVAEYGKIMIDEYTNNGICSCIKHMPGHGRVKTDPHLGLPIMNLSLKELEKDFYPFQKLNNAPAGMTAHIVIPEIDDQRPITQSPAGIKRVIRELIGFDGLLISDAIDMKALKGNIGEKTRSSLDAGCDCVCYCFGILEELEEVIKNCHFMTDKSMIRFAKIKNIIKNGNNNASIEKTAIEYQNVVGNIEKYDDSYDATEVLHRLMNDKVRGKTNV